MRLIRRRTENARLRAQSELVVSIDVRSGSLSNATHGRIRHVRRATNVPSAAGNPDRKSGFSSDPIRHFDRSAAPRK